MRRRVRGGARRRREDRASDGGEGKKMNRNRRTIDVQRRRTNLKHRPIYRYEGPAPMEAVGCVVKGRRRRPWLCLARAPGRELQYSSPVQLVVRAYVTIIPCMEFVRPIHDQLAAGNMHVTHHPRL
jgi:hypothetical protein